MSVETADIRRPFNDLWLTPEISALIPRDLEVSANVKFSIGDEPCNVCGRLTKFIAYADDPIARTRVCCRECLDRAITGDVPLR